MKFQSNEAFKGERRDQNIFHCNISIQETEFGRAKFPWFMDELTLGLKRFDNENKRLIFFFSIMNTNGV